MIDKDFLKGYIGIPYRVYQRKNFCIIKYFSDTIDKIYFWKSNIYDDLILIYHSHITIAINIKDLEKDIAYIIKYNGVLNIKSDYIFLKLQYKGSPYFANYYQYLIDDEINILNDIIICKRINNYIGFIPIINSYFVIAKSAKIINEYTVYDNIIIIPNINHYLILFKDSKFNIHLDNEDNIKKYLRIDKIDDRYYFLPLR